MKRRAFSLAVVLLASGIFVSLPSNAAERLEPGTPLTVYPEAGGNQPEPDPGPPTDKLVFTGGRTYQIELLGCTTKPLPLQNAVLVDADGPRTSRTVSVMTNHVGTSEPIPAGTRLAGITSAGSCASGGVVYREYSATVE